MSSDLSNLKMYILVRDSIDPDMAIVSVGHASLACYLKYYGDYYMREWAERSFKKVICKVNDKEFNRAKEFDDALVITESSIDNEEVCLALCPRLEWPKQVRFYKLYSCGALTKCYSCKYLMEDPHETRGKFFSCKKGHWGGFELFKPDQKNPGLRCKDFEES